MICAQLFLKLQFTLHRKWSATITITSTSICPSQRTVCVNYKDWPQSEIIKRHRSLCHMCHFCALLTKIKTYWQIPAQFQKWNIMNICLVGVAVPWWWTDMMNIADAFHSCFENPLNLHSWIGYVICSGWWVYTKRYHVKHIHHSSSKLFERQANPYFQQGLKKKKPSLATVGIKLNPGNGNNRNSTKGQLVQL